MPIALSRAGASKAAWHRQLETSGVVGALAAGTLHGIPATLVSLAAEYVQRKKTRASEVPALLRELVADHVRQYGVDRRPAATLATLAALTVSDATRALVALRGDDDPGASLSAYLAVLGPAHVARPDVVSASEAHAAFLLLQIRRGCRDPLSVVAEAVAQLAGTDSAVLPAPFVNRVLTFCRIRASYALYISTLETHARLASLYALTSWVAQFLDEKNTLARTVILEQVPDAGMWASWRPDVALLQQLESFPFRPDQLARLRPLLLLEAPDRSGRHATAKDDIPACFSTLAPIVVEPANAAGIACLFALLRTATGLGHAAVDALCDVCIAAPATPASIVLAGRILDLHDDAAITVARRIVADIRPDARAVGLMHTLAAVLPRVNTTPALQDLFRDRLVPVVLPTLTACQALYCAGLAQGHRDRLGDDVLALARAVASATWLPLDDATAAKLTRLPPDKLYRAAAERVASGGAPAAYSAFLQATVGGTDASDAEVAVLQAQIAADQELCIEHYDAERQRVLSAVRAAGVDVAFLRECRALCLKEDLVLLKDLLPLVERASPVACIDALRVLGRRRALHLAVDARWAQLLLFLWRRHGDDVIAWACDRLSVDQWFAFVHDVRSVLGDAARPELGLTQTRLDWWRALADVHSAAVADIDRRLRARGGGVASAAWLYLQRVAHTACLLDVVGGQRKLGFDAEYILRLLSPATVARVCAFLAAHRHSAPDAVRGMRTILECFYRGGVERSAAATYLAAWLAGEKTVAEAEKESETEAAKETAKETETETETEAETEMKAETSTETETSTSKETSTSTTTSTTSTAFSLLASLLDLPPPDAQGRLAVQARARASHARLLASARTVEAARVTLARQAPARSDAWAQAVGMQAVRAYTDPAVPERLADCIERTADGAYELCFPLTHLKGHERKARGIGSDQFPLLTVRVLLKDSDSANGFCVHLASHDDDAAGDHVYCRPDTDDAPRTRLCTATFNLFTYALAQRLYRHFRTEPVSLDTVHDLVADVVRRPGSQCTTCGDALPGVWRPTVCARPACADELAHNNLLVRAYGLLVDAPVLDLLLCCVYAAAADVSQLELLGPGCPLDKQRLRTVLDSFPALPRTDDDTPFGLLKKILATDTTGQSRAERKVTVALGKDREAVLAWMAASFRACILSAPPGKRLPIMADVEQFVLYNSAPEPERAFANAPQPSSVVFHGSKPARLWRVLAEGLRNMSGTAYMATGAVNGPGIYMADEPTTSFGYSGPFANTWARSAFRNKKVLLGCELKDPAMPETQKTPGTHIVTDESRVLVRYIFICPPAYAMPPARHVDNAMRSTYAQLRGSLA